MANPFWGDDPFSQTPDTLGQGLKYLAPLLKGGEKAEDSLLNMDPFKPAKASHSGFSPIDFSEYGKDGGTDLLNKIMGQYHTSDYAKYQEDEMTKRIGAAAASSGMTNTPAEQQALAKQIQGLASKDQMDWMKTALGASEYGATAASQQNEFGADLKEKQNQFDARLASQQNEFGYSQDLDRYKTLAALGIQAQSQAQDIYGDQATAEEKKEEYNNKQHHGILDAVKSLFHQGGGTVSGIFKSIGHIFGF